MKTAAASLFIMVVLAGGFVSGQASPSRQKSITYGPATQVIANDLRDDESRRTTFTRGAVRIVSESSTMTADEADVHLLRSTRTAVDLDIVLRGNVRVLVTPQNGALR